MVYPVFALAVCALLCSSSTAAPLPQKFVYVNMVDAWWLYIGEEAGGRNESMAHMAAACLGAGFTAFRFSATSYWPNTMKSTYFSNENAWWTMFDGFIADAKSVGCSEIPRCVVLMSMRSPCNHTGENNYKLL